MTGVATGWCSARPGVATGEPPGRREPDASGKQICYIRFSA